MVDSTGNSCIFCRITASNATIPVIAAKATTPINAIGPILLISNNDPDIAKSKTDNAVAATIDACIGNVDNKYSTPANAPTTKVRTIIVPSDAFAPFATAVITANIPISIDIAIVAPASFLGSIIDNPATAAAIIPIATVMTINSLFIFLARLVAYIINDMIVPRIVTAVTPFTSPSILIKLNIIATPAIIPIAIENAKIVAAIFGTSGPAFLTI